jgi:hypothetical protein
MNDDTNQREVGPLQAVALGPSEAVALTPSGRTIEQGFALVLVRNVEERFPWVQRKRAQQRPLRAPKVLAVTQPAERRW